MALRRDLEALRASLLSDPYFAEVPSMRPESRKTAVAFHAKDDLPEVRWKVFETLRAHDLKFIAVVRDKRQVAAEVAKRTRERGGPRYNPNDLYDSMITRLLRDCLHKGSRIHIHVAIRGNRARTEAFKAAIARARANFHKKWGIEGEADIKIISSRPPDFVGLQAVDYFLWSLQRAYERGEYRFLKLMWPQFRLVMDIDDTRDKVYGAYYNQAKPLGPQVLEGRRGI